MNRNTGSRPASQYKGINPMWTGILIGLIVGVSLAAGVTWYLMKSPSPFLKKEQMPVNTTSNVGKPAASTEAAGTNTKSSAALPVENNGKPRFEFYKVLTDKQDATVGTTAKSAEKLGPDAAKPMVSFEPHVLQAGSFSKADDAEKLKARLALLGVQANVQEANIPDRGIWYRVRLGPYKDPEELNRTRSFLKQNGVESTPIRVQ